MGTRNEAVARRIEAEVEALGYEFVELEWAGSAARPILRLRIDVPGSVKGQGVTVQDCARVSRGLEEWLDAAPELSERYTLEVSSPGVERPLVRRRDFERFAGAEVRVKAIRAPEGLDSARFEAVLEGVEGEGEEAYRVRFRLAGGEALVLPRSAVAKAHLLYRWEEDGWDREA
jgi:ribosome maturation factor RimP